MTNIAAILTVFNRRQKTLSCLTYLFQAVSAYNEQEMPNDNIDIAVYLTDDGCTDGTAQAIRESFPMENIRILQGDGNLFWAGGMRKSWQAAIDDKTAYDYYLLLNDDTTVNDNVFTELFEADSYGVKTAGVHGLSSGITCAPGDSATITYGGLNFVSKAKGRQELLQPTGSPQHIDLVHANILLVHNSVVEKIGIFYKGYLHGCADNDYGMMAHHHHLPVFSTSHICGECERDHHTNMSETEYLMSLSRSQRKAFINSPTHSDKDYLLFVRRNLKLRYPFAWLARTLRLNCPKLYFHLTNKRGLYKNSTVS